MNAPSQTGTEKALAMLAWSTPGQPTAEELRRLGAGLNHGDLSVRFAARHLGITIDALANLFRNQGQPVPFDL